MRTTWCICIATKHLGLKIDILFTWQISLQNIFDPTKNIVDSHQNLCTRPRSKIVLVRCALFCLIVSLVVSLVVFNSWMLCFVFIFCRRNVQEIDAGGAWQIAGHWSISRRRCWFARRRTGLVRLLAYIFFD